ncbi:class I SAM-dependent methyltransferase [Pelovirga terrestris]|uniref:Methyltransferase domain-containing protein n=1 Tax=Pelovirga terrestris TaxID=2771352 RepID=A0A8J6ULS1_9BACT|nr:class I SAM-dependent methyltransferase [Pelovirga terrestris]MBD1401672.1 methyltransferase domain-containing protein [Pelovirga terrestris]
MKQNASHQGSLSRIVPWSHELLAEVLSPGDLAVDLTAGRGQDTLALWQMVGEQGQVVAFDVQQDALIQTQQRLSASGATVRMVDQAGLPLLASRPGVDLLYCCHSRYADIVFNAPTAIIANLGYLPGGDQQLMTRPDTTLAALHQALAGLAVGGRMAVVIYPGHVGGAEEAICVERFFSALDSNKYDVLQVQLPNRNQAPGLLVVEKRTSIRRGRCSSVYCY